MVANRDGGAEAESRRILDRVSRESESGGRRATGAARTPSRDAPPGSDIDADDKAEYWGTRIGRILSLVFVVGLMIWLVLFLVRGG